MKQMKKKKGIHRSAIVMLEQHTVVLSPPFKSNA